MNIIFCLSYLNVPNTIIIAENYSSEFIIFTTNDKIKKLFEELYGKERVCFIELPMLNRRKPFQSYWIVQKAKKKALHEFRHYNNCSVFIFFSGFCFFEGWIVKKLSKKNTVFHKQEVVLGLKASTWKGLHKFLLVYFLYGIKTSFHYHYGNFLLQVVSNSYLRKINARSVEINLDIEIAKRLINQRYLIDGTDILLLIGSTVAEGFVSEQEYIKKMDGLINRIKQSGYSICIKKHPRYDDIFSLEKEQKQISKYLPANLIYDNFANIIGYTTSTLYEAANDNHNCISLLDYFCPRDMPAAKDQMQYLKNNLKQGHRIQFPKDLDEIISLLKKAHS